MNRETMGKGGRERRTKEGIMQRREILLLVRNFGQREESSEDYKGEEGKRRLIKGGNAGKRKLIKGGNVGKRKRKEGECMQNDISFL